MHTATFYITTRNLILYGLLLHVRLISKAIFKDLDINKGIRSEWEKALGISLHGHIFTGRTDQILRNCVHPELGLHIFRSQKTANPSSNIQLSFNVIAEKEE